MIHSDHFELGGKEKPHMNALPSIAGGKGTHVVHD